MSAVIRGGSGRNPRLRKLRLTRSIGYAVLATEPGIMDEILESRIAPQGIIERVYIEACGHVRMLPIRFLQTRQALFVVTEAGIGDVEESRGISTPAAIDRIMQLTDNAGATDEHRALNYLAMRYQAVYASVAEAFARNSSLTAIAISRGPSQKQKRPR